MGINPQDSKALFYEALVKYLEEEGYYNIRQLPDERFICLYEFLFTTGIIVNPTFGGYDHRYCYLKRQDAIDAINVWDGMGDPTGNWVAKK